MSTFLVVLWTFLLTFLLAFLLFHWDCRQRLEALRRKQQKESRELHRHLNEDAALFAAMDLGVLYYPKSGQLSTHNLAAEELFGTIPETYHQFLDKYGESNGLLAQLTLGKGNANAIVPLENHQIYLDVHTVDSADGLAHLVLARDVTREFQDEKQRKVYVSNVSHELRTPLTTIRSYAESLVDWGSAEKKREQIKKDVSRILDESVRMERLIEDLNLLSSVDEASISRYMHIEAQDLGKLVRGVVERMQDQTLERQIHMSFTLVNPNVWIYGDRSHIERIVSNLITNAIKYGRDGGSIKVYVSAVRDEVYLKVKDDGQGIDEKDQVHIFERFYRVDDSRARKSGGRGLGLAIVKELVELHDGRISVESVITRGSEFTVMFPSAAKVLYQTLVDLHVDGTVSHRLYEAAIPDLTSLAEKMGLVAQWKSLDRKAYEAILQKVKNLSWKGK